MQIFKLKFLSALHVDSKGSGEPETADEFIRSDTLSAALCIAWSNLFPNTGPDFFDAPPFTVSSAFPFIGDLLLFPVPVWRIWNGLDDAERKEFKKVVWLSQSLFERVISGAFLTKDDAEILPGGIAISKQELKDRPKLKGRPAWIMTERQRVGVDRLWIPGKGSLFFFALQFFSPDAGLWFAAQSEPETMKKLASSHDFLGDTGIGADRNSGLGHFQASFDDFKVNTPDEKAGWMNLSLFNPEENTNRKALCDQAVYGLTSRSGWITSSGAGRPPIRVFMEGSYFPIKPAGRVVPMLDDNLKKIVGLQHSAPRDFRTICLPCAAPRNGQEAGKEDGA